MYSTPSRSSASRIMSAPVNLVSVTPFKNEEAPTFRSGAFAIYSRCLLARACPRLTEANKAQESKEEYEGPGRDGHVDLNVNDRAGLWVVSRAQIPAAGFG